MIKLHQSDVLLACLIQQIAKLSEAQRALFDSNVKQMKACKCPVSLEVMVNPMIMLPGGQSIDKRSYDKLLDPKTNPLNNSLITSCEENRVLKSVIDGYWEALQTLADDLASSASLQSVGMFAGPSGSEPAAKRRRVDEGHPADSSAANYCLDRGAFL